MITIIGIGMQKGELTVNAAREIAAAKCVYLRSAETTAGKAVYKEYPHIRTLDEYFEQADSFDGWCDKACDAILAAEKEFGDVFYLTDGDGYTDSCAAALSLRGANVSFDGGVAPHAARRAGGGEVCITACDAVTRRPYLDTVLGTHILEVDDAYLAGECKLWLMEHYGDETPVTVCLKGKTQSLPLHAIDGLRGYDYSCSFYIAPQEGFYKDKYGFGDLDRIMRRLTAADGCPWDKVQTHESIRINMIEEAYEAVDAIDNGDVDAQIEEMGDVILQSVLHGDIARRCGEYDISDVLGGLCRKLVTRHTHIFGENKAQNADEALSFWEAAKAEEKSYVSTADKLNRLPECFPALLAAEKVYKKLIKAGVQPDESAVISPAKCFADATEAECARKLFWIVAALSEKGIDAEAVLSSYVAKLKKEFAAAEQAGDVAGFLRKS